MNIVKELINKIATSMAEEPDAWTITRLVDSHANRLSCRNISVDDDDGFTRVDESDNSHWVVPLSFWQKRRLKKIALQLVVEKALRKWDRRQDEDQQEKG